MPKTNKLRVLETSTGNWDDLCEELSDGKVFYGLCRFRVKEIFRYVYISWCGEGVQGVAAGSYNNHALFLQRVFRVIIFINFKMKKKFIKFLKNSHIMFTLMHVMNKI